MTDLIEASQIGDLENVVKYLEAGDDVHVGDDRPLRCAVEQGRTKVV